VESSGDGHGDGGGGFGLFCGCPVIAGFRRFGTFSFEVKRFGTWERRKEGKAADWATHPKQAIFFKILQFFSAFSNVALICS
jgi:hypothetical protein